MDDVIRDDDDSLFMSSRISRAVSLNVIIIIIGHIILIQVYRETTYTVHC